MRAKIVEYQLLLKGVMEISEIVGALPEPIDLIGFFMLRIAPRAVTSSIYLIIYHLEK